MWSPTVILTLLGATLATAAPFTANSTHGTIEPLGCEIYSHIFPDGVAPVNMALVEDPAAELKKCKLDAFKKCLTISKVLPKTSFKGCLKSLGKKCKLAEVVAPVVADVILPAEEKNKTLPFCGNELPEKILDIISEQRNKTAPAALERRQKSECPKACAVWSALPPFGVWFAACMADCARRCARGPSSCP